MRKEIVCLALPGAQLLDISGPLDVFAEANAILGRVVYRMRVMGLDQQIVTSSSGVKIVPDLSLRETLTGPLDSFLVAGAPAAAGVNLDAHSLAALAACCRQSQRYGSVCTGALVLAATGLMDGFRVTTHWAVCGELARRYPGVRVNGDEIYICDGPLRTAAGVTSGLDLALRMVEEDLGREVALAIAANLVMFFTRPVGQGHFSRSGRASLAGRSSLQDMQRWAVAHLDEVKKVKTLADHMQLSTRHFTRLFQEALGVAPARWLEQERVAKARDLLESSRLAPKEIAAACGFSSVDILRRAFLRRLKTTPTQYRRYYIGLD
ncbi:GlxA family transcriptional regulator [Sodalis sp. C49]|uniref:GlxA family transcriptional regulator n=1 Tax=Sodalis sp. C49 TaxID=3228929 RepID=UPI003965AFC8